MIFCLGDDLLRQLAKTESKLEYDEDLSKKLISLVESDVNCLLTESGKILKYGPIILENKHVSKNMKRIIIYCFNQYSMMFGIQKNVSCRIIITNEVSNYSEIKITPEYLIENKLNLNNAVALLSEDTTDCEFYDDLSSKLNDKVGVKIEFRHVGAAGKNIAKALTKAITHNHDIVFAICDSDKFHPEDNVGDTAKYLIDEAEKLSQQNYVHFGHNILEVSEKENLIKPSEYQKVHGQSKKLEPYLIMEKDQKMMKYLRYFDFKSGLKKEIYIQRPEYYFDLIEGCHQYVNEIDRLKNSESIIRGLGRTCINNLQIEDLNFEKTQIDIYRKNISKEVFSWGISVQQQKLI